MEHQQFETIGITQGSWTRDSVVNYQPTWGGNNVTDLVLRHRIDGNHIEFTEERLVELLRPVFLKLLPSLLAEVGVLARVDLDPHVLSASPELARRLSYQVACCGYPGDGCCDPCGLPCSRCGSLPCSCPKADPQVRAELKTVSRCCQADVFRDGDRWLCSRCRVGTKPIQVSAA